jgi:hypothetical protein
MAGEKVPVAVYVAQQSGKVALKPLFPSAWMDPLMVGIASLWLIKNNQRLALKVISSNPQSGRLEVAFEGSL